MAKEYKVLEVSEGALGTLFTGSSKLPLKKIEADMNEYGRKGGIWTLW